MQKRFHEKLKMIENAANATHLVQEALANEATTEGSGDSPKQSATATSISLYLEPARWFCELLLICELQINKPRGHGPSNRD